MALAPGDGESEVPKYSKCAFSVVKSLGSPDPGKVQRGKTVVLTSGMCSKQKRMSVVKWSKGQFPGERGNDSVTRSDLTFRSFCFMEQGRRSFLSSERGHQEHKDMDFDCSQLELCIDSSWLEVEVAAA